MVLLDLKEREAKGWKSNAKNRKLWKKLTTMAKDGVVEFKGRGRQLI